MNTLWLAEETYVNQEKEGQTPMKLKQAWIVYLLVMILLPMTGIMFQYQSCHHEGCPHGGSLKVHSTTECRTPLFYIFPFSSPYTPYVLHFGPFPSYAVPTQSFLYLISCLIPPPPPPLSKGREELRTTSFLLFLFMRKLLFRVSTLSSAIYFHLFSSLFSSHGKTSLCKGYRELQMLSFGSSIFCFRSTEQKPLDSRVRKVQPEKKSVFFFQSHYYAEN